MICQKCNHILSGSESFCPDCGTPCVKTKEKDYYREPEAPSVIFSPEKDSSSQIFSDEAPRHLPPERGERKSHAGLYLVIILCAVILGAVTISATHLFDFTPAIASIFSGLGQNEDITESEEASDYDPQSSIVLPSVNYRTTIAYITGSGGQALRKGPADSYGQIDVLSEGLIVHIIGAASVSDTWVYVYVPEKDAYGWISDSFLSSSLAEKEESTQVETTANTEKQ